jgi:hypothetical protein
MYHEEDEKYESAHSPFATGVAIGWIIGMCILIVYDLHCMKII